VLEFKYQRKFGGEIAGTKHVTINKTALEMRITLSPTKIYRAYHSHD
jgi:hypothetical protein